MCTSLLSFYQSLLLSVLGHIVLFWGYAKAVFIHTVERGIILESARGADLTCLLAYSDTVSRRYQALNGDILPHACAGCLFEQTVEL